MLIPLSLFACGLTSSSYLHQASRLACERAKECDPESFDSLFDNLDQCRDFYAPFENVTEDCYADCSFDAQKARECLDVARKASCDDLADPACDQVYDCTGAASYEECASGLLRDSGD